jgi:hypothetical protein
VSRLCEVDTCARPAHDGRGVCEQHGWELQQALAEVPELADALDTTLARQRGTTYGAGGASSVPRLPFDYRASEAGFLLRNCLVGWVRDIQADPARHPADTLGAIARWLLARLDLLLAHPAAGEVVGEILAAVHEATRAVDNRPEKVFLGRCDCGADLLALPERDRVTCKECGADYLAEDQRAVLAAALDDRLVTAAEYAGMLVHLGDRVDRDRVRVLVNVWATRGRITVHTGADGPRYRFGELQARMSERTDRRTG